MESLLRIVRLFAMVLWVGGLVFFAFVLAPVAFHVMPSTHEAGLVVGGTLPILHWIGLVCGVLFLAATFVMWLKRQGSQRTACLVQMLLVTFMLTITVYLQASVLPAMERDRAQAGGNIDAAPADNAARLDFERLHPLSERFEGAALFAGLGIVLLLGLERPGWKQPGTIHS